MDKKRFFQETLLTCIHEKTVKSTWHEMGALCSYIVQKPLQNIPNIQNIKDGCEKGAAFDPLPRTSAVLIEVQGCGA